MGCKPPRWLVGFCLLAISRAWGATAPDVSVATTPAVSVSSPVVVSTQVWKTVPNDAFEAGEDLFYVVKWGIITGGHSNLSIHGIDRIADRPAYHIVSEARSVGLADMIYKTRDKNETWLDVESLVTVRYEKHVREGRYRVEEMVEIDQANRRVKDYSERLDKGTTTFSESNVPTGVMDVLGSLYYIRTLPLEIGQTYTLDIYNRNKIWPLVVEVIKRQKVKVPAGKFNTIMVEPMLREPGIFIRKGKKLQVWMTDDAYHMPVLMRSEVAIGHVAAELVTYSRSTSVPTELPEPETPPAPPNP